MTGFRLAKGGVQELLSIKADIVTYGKVVGGGLPVGGFGGKRELMQELSVTVEKLYKEMQPEINSMISCVDPISPEAWGATVDILTNVLNSQDTWDTINT